MKRKTACWSLLILAILLFGGQAWALDQYVSDKLQVTVRTGPTTENKVLAVVSSGDKLEMLGSEQNGWVRVRTPGGKEGWMLARYLQEEKPAVLRLKELDPQASKLMERVTGLEKENQELKAQLKESQTSASKVKNSLVKLRSETADVIKLKAEYDRLQKEFANQAKRLDEVSAESESLKFGNNLKWFLAGAGVLVLGWILGLIMGRKKKRWNSNLY